MGGQEGKYFAQFCKLAIEAYKQLRRNAVLIMSLLRLMKDAGIEALQVDPESRLRFVEERFRLDLGDEEGGEGVGGDGEEAGGGGEALASFLEAAGEWRRERGIEVADWLAQRTADADACLDAASHQAAGWDATPLGEERCRA